MAKVQHYEPDACYLLIMDYKHRNMVDTDHTRPYNSGAR